MHELPLTGLDGANPLAFLATLGVLRALSRSLVNTPRLAWAARNGAWRPMLMANVATPKALTDELVEAFSHLDAAPIFTVGDDLNFSPQRYREYSSLAARTSHAQQGRHAEFAASFANESIVNKNGVVEDTALRTMSGAGHQHFIMFMRNLMKKTNAEHLRKALFEQWRYGDPVTNMTLRWDPSDDSRYALRWNDPSGDPERKRRGAMWGANRLAIEGLPLLPVMPGKRQLETTGFRTAGSRRTFFTWPLWTAPLDLDSVRSLLALELLQDEKPDRAELAARGVGEIYRSQRLTVGKFRNFTRGVPA